MSPLVFNARPRYDLRPCLTPGHHPAHEGREPLIEHVANLIEQGWFEADRHI